MRCRRGRGRWGSRVFLGGLGFFFGFHSSQYSFRIVVTGRHLFFFGHNGPNAISIFCHLYNDYMNYLFSTRFWSWCVDGSCPSFHEGIFKAMDI